MKSRGLIIIVVLGFIVFSASTFVLDPTKQAVIIQLGNPIRVVTDPGLHFKIPFIQEARIFDKRLLEWDGRPRSLTTLDKVSIYIDTTARWKIIDPLMYLQSIWGNLQAAGILKLLRSRSFVTTV